MVARALLALGTLAIALFAGEVTLRALDFPRPQVEMPFLGDVVSESSFVEDDRLFWRLRENDPVYRPNAVGMRGFWPSRPKLPADLRLLCVGDSTTFGVFQRLEETYGARLERGLQERLPRRNAQTIHAALPGYTTHQNRLFVEEHVDALRPDLTVLYCGAWNDFIPAVGITDGERSRRAVRPRILRLVAAALDEAVLSRREYADAFRRGEAPHGRRVPLSEFVANLEALVEAARRHGGRAVAILPPTPEETARKFPVSMDYARATREVMERLGVPLLDGTALLAAFEEACPEPWRGGAGGDSVGYVDWIHLSATGHAVLAEALLDLLGEPLAAVGTEAGFATRTVDLRLEADGPIRALATTTARLVADGEVRLEDVERVWIGAQEVSFDQGTGGEVTVHVPETLIPGEHVVSVVSSSQRLLSSRPVRVAGTRLTAAVEDVEGSPHVAIDAEVPPGWRLVLWMAEERRATPVSTRFGPFHLAADPDGAHPDRRELPFIFRRLDLPAIVEVAGESGRVRARRPLPMADSPDPPRLIHLQGGVTDPGRPGAGALTEALTLPLGG